MTENNNNLRKEGEFESRVVKHRIPRKKRRKRERRNKRFENILTSIQAFICEVFSGYLAWIVSIMKVSLKLITICITAYLILILVFKMESEQAILTSIDIVKQLKLKSYI